MPGPPGKEASEPPSVNLSFANNFWGKDDAGVGPMLERMHNAKVTSDELKSFYAARAAIEDEYARKLLNLSRKPLGSSESGTLKLSLNVIREQVESMGKAHQSIAQQMKTELEEPLAAFAGGLKERRKIVQNGIEKLLRTKMQQTAAVNKTRDRYEQDCLKIKGFLAQAHMVMGQEERKNKAKLEKTQIQLSTSSSEYEAAVKVLEETTGRWNRDWKAACDKFQDLEEERIDFTKSSLWTFANIASTVCVSDDAACEQIRLSLEDCDVEKDITTFIKESGTGQEIPDPPKFINFCRGDADTASEASDEGNYSVAQFQRTMNPAYRGASPQPSVFESHHDPNNPLAKELGHEETNAIPLQEPAMPPPRQQAQPIPAAQPMPQPAPQQSRGVQPDPRLIQAQQQARQNYQQSQVPHNDYPMDGMTQFCRIGAPSDRSTNPSPMRPSSRDSQSDYSNPTSFSSVEPPSGSASPGKPMAPASPQPVEERPEPKRKGFFQNHSPFRRRSKHEIIPPTSVSPNRNTWGAASNRRDESRSPTKRFGGGILDTDGRSASPEPVDPRANFQLNIGNNVFDVASPDAHSQNKAPKQEQEELDPIAQALAELKGVTKQSSLRVSADRYAGLATPIPPGTPAVGAAPTGSVPTPLTNVAINPAQREPPPSYDQPMSRLGAPKPAHTSRAMQQTTQRYIDQKVNMFNTGSTTRPPTRGGQEAPRAASPAPPRAVSPRPGPYQAQTQTAAEYRAVSPSPRAPSPNPYAAPSGAGRPAYAPSVAGGRQAQQSPSTYTPTTARPPVQSPGSYSSAGPGTRPRASTATTSVKSPYGNPTSRGSYSSSRGGSPSHTAVPRAVSPQPQPQPAYASTTRPISRAAGPHSRAASPNPAFRQSYDRPSSSRGSDMALQLAPGPGSERGEGSVYGGSQRGRGNSTQSQHQRPMSSYYGGGDPGYGGGAGGMGGQLSTRVRSRSVAEPRQYTKDGRMILHYSRAMYTYAAQIPEELSFTKGDILAVLRLQDDGWWEAEVVGKNGRPGLVPSNYLQNC
ncbi:uncharacterized protein EI97DRAFT_118930 [Westerdykella ornata]|uniref:Cell division control protein n=1 Tax=Westerdykella ornata TaxID=318751 RepID=A0A6A6JX57_WESOR|nr:uncharacterized protein EI97DRAFT_118930 [Westerdykella ornata]KAF2280316.1 hypothetical protein EI97DRAFT_118930 [Westerdykella ornata]